MREYTLFDDEMLEAWARWRRDQREQALTTALLGALVVLSTAAICYAAYLDFVARHVTR